MCICDVERPDYDEETGEELYAEEQRIAQDDDLCCCECGHSIIAGSTYKYIHGRWDGDWSTYRQCLGCAALGDRFVNQTDCCYAFTGLYEELIDSNILCQVGEEEVWIEQESWLKVVCQHPLKCEVIVEEVA